MKLKIRIERPIYHMISVSGSEMEVYRYLLSCIESMVLRLCTFLLSVVDKNVD